MEQFGERPEKEVQLWDYLNVVLKRKWAALAFFVVVVVVVMVGTFATKPVYKATCQVLIEREAPKVVKIQEVLSLDARYGFDYYQTQYELLRNSFIAQWAIKELELEDHPEFKQKKGFAAALARGLKNLLIYSVVYSKNKKTHTPDKEAQLISAYLSRLKIGPIRNSRLVNISFETHDPELAAQMANTHAKLYIQYTWERKLNASQDAAQWLDQQIKEVKKKLEVSEEALQKYQREHNIVSIDFGERKNEGIGNQKIIDLSGALTQAKTIRMEKENIHKEIERISGNPGMIESMPAVVNNPLIQQLKADYIKLKAEYSELSKKFGPKHPQMVRLESQRGEIRGRIAQEAREIARSIETEYRIALAKEQSLIEELKRQKGETLEPNEKEIQYNVLKRDVEATRSLFDSLLQRIRETSLTEELNLTNISVANPARAPKSPIKPKKSQNLILALIVGLTGGVGIAFFFEYLDPSIKSSVEIKGQLGLTFLGHVEKMESVDSHSGDKGLVALHHPQSPVTEEFRYIATNILFSIPDKPQKVILITSAIAEEGKSTVAANIAVVMAYAGKKVLLIDADMRKPTIHSLFDVLQEPGLSNHLAQGADFSSFIRQSSTKGLHLVAAGTSPPNPSELLFSQRMADFIEAMRDKFDIIILDSPPVMMLSDAPAVAQGTDGVIMVVKSGATARPIIKKAVQQLLQVGARLTGAVLNCHDITSESYHYHSYYRDYYHRYYGKEEKGTQQDRV